ncbi:MAG: hypothetical protein L0Y71_12760 [Gemmataceae bacterium]|nr:hypothetical protein [Gemmataceae bacterium]
MQRYLLLVAVILSGALAVGPARGQHRGPRPGELDAEYSNNVISLRNKSALDQEIDQLREKWNAKYGPRIGLINPYEGTSYYRYYDDHGNLAVIKFREAYDGAERMRKDFAQARKRALDAADKVEQECQAAVYAYGVVVANQTKAAAAREAMQNWLNKIGAANTPRRPVAPPPVTTAPVIPDPTTSAPEPAPSTGPYSVYVVRNGATQRLGVRSTQDAAAAYGNRIRNTIGVTSVYVTDAQGNVVQRIR